MRNEEINFKFDSILNFRENIEEGLKGELYDVKAQLEREEMRLESLINFYIRKTKGLLRKDDLTPSELTLCKDYLKRIRNELENSKRMVDVFRKKAKEKQEALIAARKERKVLEVMKKKKPMLRRY